MKIDGVPTGHPCWIELFTSDPDKARPFYGELFGWTSEDAGPEFGNYINFAKDGERVAGCMRNDGSSGAPDLWTVYLSSDDAEKTCELVTSNGGQVHVAPMAVGDLGTMAFVMGPDGAAVGIWQPGEHKSFAYVAEANAPSWFELWSRDHDTSVAFYRDTFNWDTHVAGDTDEFRYTTLGEGESQAAGIMDASAFLPEGIPAHWSVYFGTDNADATIARATKLGATVVQPAEDTPYGRLAVLTDPTGAQFKLVQPPAAA